MRSSTIASIGMLVATPLAAAVPAMKRQSTCTANLGGSNSEGGGGPGQAPVNRNGWAFGITGGPKDYGKTISTDSGGAFDFTVGTADYGGSHNMDIRASWNYGGNSWSSCMLSLDGGDFMSVEPTQSIESNTVSVTTSKCTWTFDC